MWHLESPIMGSGGAGEGGWGPLERRRERQEGDPSATRPARELRGSDDDRGDLAQLSLRLEPERRGTERDRGARS